MLEFAIIPLIFVALFLAYAMQRRRRRQLAFIDSYEFHPAMVIARATSVALLAAVAIEGMSRSCR